MSLAKRLNLGAALAVGLLGLMAEQALAQRAQQTKEGASIVVEGVVREVFRSPRQTQTDYLVQVEVSRSEYGRSPADTRRVQAPAPGDQIYIHVSQANDNRGRLGGAPAGTLALPDERTQIRAYLYPRAQGGWEGAYPDWYDQLNASIAGRGAHDPEPPADVSLKPAPAPGSAPAAPTQADSILQKLGVKAEQVQVNGRLVFKVTEVIPSGPAQNAGIEPGDAIIGINNGFITSIDQFAATLLKGSLTTLAVLDVNSGKTASVRVDMSSVSGAPAPAPRPTPTPAPSSPPGPPRVLGVKTEVVRVGLRSTALRVTEVQPASSADKAGIEKGDVIVAANNTPTGDLQSLNAAIQSSGPVLTLTIRDSRTGKDVPVQVQLGGAPGTAPTGNTPAPGSPTGGGAVSSQSLGIITEAGTADLLPVVKVVRVQPGSPAEKAGIEEGDAIVGLNDKVIFAPDLLDEALKNAGSSFTLNVLDVKTGRKTPVKVNLP